MHPLPCFFALLLLLLFADAHSENLIEQVILPVDQPFDNNNNNNNTLTRSLYTIETEIIAAKYTYLMKLRVKTSDDADCIETYAIPDTGSDLIWLNVKGCCGDACHCCSCETKCIEKPKQLFTCEDNSCKALVESLKIEKKCSLEQFCMYDINTYADGFTTQGWFGKGKFSFRIIDKADNIFNSKETDFEDDFKFGVSKMSKGPLEPKSQGIVGLGRGSLSLLRQNHLIDLKFSYCLPNPESPKPKSKIIFGHKVATSDKFTRLQQGVVCGDRYCVHLATISVGDRDEDKIKVIETNKVMVIDSGSTFTSLVDGLFNDFLTKVKNVIGSEHKPKKVNHYDNCFEESAVSAEKLKKVSFEFGDGGGSGTTKIELKRENFFDRYTSDEGNKYLCLTVVDGDNQKNNHGRPLREEDFHHRLGNRAQMDFLVAFDLKDNKVSFDDMKSCGEENLELPVLSE